MQKVFLSTWQLDSFCRKLIWKFLHTLSAVDIQYQETVKYMIMNWACTKLFSFFLFLFWFSGSLGPVSVFNEGTRSFSTHLPAWIVFLTKKLTGTHLYGSEICIKWTKLDLQINAKRNPIFSEWVQKSLAIDPKLYWTCQGGEWQTRWSEGWEGEGWGTVRSKNMTVTK